MKRKKQLSTICSILIRDTPSPYLIHLVNKRGPIFLKNQTTVLTNYTVL